MVLRVSFSRLKFQGQFWEHEEILVITCKLRLYIEWTCHGVTSLIWGYCNFSV